MTIHQLGVKPLVKSLAIAFGAMGAVGVVQAQQQSNDQQQASGQNAQVQQRIEVTGSRLRRAETEGAVPVTVIDRAAIEASGQNSVSELMRDVTFASFGNTRPQSGSSAQALSDIDLRGLGSNRTLVLVDGRRLAKAPFSGQSQDLNSVPLAAVERIEILTDGASAVYGSDAIGGVVNIITRKNFNGAQVNYGEGDPSIVGGDTKEMSILYGTSSSKGRVFAGLSSQSRGMVFTRDQQGYVQGVSTFGNNYRRLNASGTPTGAHIPVPGFNCAGNGFYFTAPGAANNICSFDFNSVAANEASVGNKSLFANGEFNISEDWTFYANGSMTNVDSFGRYAPAPVQVNLPAGSAAYNSITSAVPGLAAASPGGLSLRHRTAATGNRDNYTDATVAAVMAGVKGRLFDRIDVDLGVRSEKYSYIETGRNYIVRPLLEQAIVNGSYNIRDPFGNPAEVLNSVKAVITRDSTWDTKEVFGSVSADLFKIDGRAVTGILGFESRKEFYADLYDSLQESGVIEGAAGNSAAGSRKVNSSFFEVAVPVLKNLEISLAGRTDSYNDVGSDFTPKLSARFQPIKNLTLRGSVGKGFRAPTLDILTQKPSFSADSVTDLQTCRSLGGTVAQCSGSNPLQIQIDATVIANPLLRPEKSDQNSFGLVFDPTSWLSITMDAWDIKINDRITAMTAQTIINRTLNPSLGPVPSNFGVVRDPATGGIVSLTRGNVNEGTLDANGFDLSFKTDFRPAGFGRIQNELRYSQTSNYKLNGGRNLVGDQGAPKYRVNFGTTWTFGRFTTNLAVNTIAAQPGDDAPNNAGVPTKSYTTANLNVAYRHPTKTTLLVGVNNISGKLPELNGYDGRPWNFNLYDSYGRQVFFRVSQAF